LGLLLAALLAQAGAARPTRAAKAARPPAERQQRATHESTYDQWKPSLFTIEVHSGNVNAKSTLGSGYLVSRGGHVVTNYHVVGSYVGDPSAMLGPKHIQPVGRLLSFDPVTIWRCRSTGRPRGPRGRHTAARSRAAVVAFGIEGLGLSTKASSMVTPRRAWSTGCCCRCRELGHERQADLVPRAR
jgi:hypothetical protein